MSDLREQIQTALAAFNGQPLREAALGFFKTLGYSSQRTVIVPKSSPRAFLDLFAKNAGTGASASFDQGKALFADWLAADLLFQLTDQELSREVALFPETGVSAGQLRSYIFFAIELKERAYPRGKLATLTRQLNRLFPTPVMVLIKHRDLVSLAVINRRPNKLDQNKDVLGRVTLIRDISLAAPHRGHLDILVSLAVSELEHPEKKPIADFDTLHAAWERIFNIELLNARFYRELANWYFWALPQVEFPTDLEPDSEKRRATGLIRLLTRLIFCWFLKEKELVPDKLFHPADLAKLLKGFDSESEASSTYYHAILQNLFFATLNQRMGEDSKGQPYRAFAKDEGFQKNRATYDINNLYRYESLFAVSEEDALALFADIPFLNGGLFECLDRTDEATGKKCYLDGFSRNPKKRPRVPDRLFFDSGETVNLSEAYGDKKRKTERVTGLIHILNRYKFTIVENTPIDQEIALDPELLGKVFENLLASYNEETKTTARKQTGSFYTPRPIVEYMVDESLKAGLAQALGINARMTAADANAGFEILFTYTEKDHPFTPAETATLIAAIDNLKILDPACGSGAFPMGVLHKLVYILGKLDPHNDRWKQRQIDTASQIPDPSARAAAIDAIERVFADNDDDYGRKLYLIENCLYGADIQPIAIQITKLRFFISLVADQKTNNDKRDNHGIRPLPNLETKFVAANTLVGIPKGEAAFLNLNQARINEIEKELESAYHQHFSIQVRSRKLALQKRTRELRSELAAFMENFAGMREERAKALANWDPFNPQLVADFFDPQWMFGLKLAAGFDIVIGNPPYIQLQNNGGALSKLYGPKKIERKTVPSPYQVFDGMGDLYFLFYERGWHLLSEKGYLCFITSNKWMRMGAGENLRKFFSEKTHAKLLIDFAGQKIFESATVDTNILLFQKRATGGALVAQVSKPAQIGTDGSTKAGSETCATRAVIGAANCRENLSVFVRQHAAPTNFPDDGSSWVILNPIEQGIKVKIEKIGIPLKDWDISINYGIKTGFNDAFIVSEEKRNEILANCKTADERKRTVELIRPILRGRDIKRYSYKWAELYLIVTHNGIPEKGVQKIDIEKYPAVKKHLDGFRKQIEARMDQGDTPYHLRSCVYMDDFSRPKIVWADLARTGNAFTLDMGKHFVGNTGYILTMDEDVEHRVGYDFLLAALNSKAILFYLDMICNRLDETGWRWFCKDVELLPIPMLPVEEQGNIRCIIQSELHQKTITGQQAIDEFICQLYGLTREEVKFLNRC